MVSRKNKNNIFKKEEFKDKLDKNSHKLLKKVGALKLIYFCIKILLYEKSFLIYILIISLFSLSIAFTLPFFNNQALVVKVFDFYILIYISSFLFILILKTSNFFLGRKVEDKTIFIVLSNQISRSKYFITQFIIIILVSWINILFSYTIINILYLAFSEFRTRNVLVLKTATFLWFSFIFSFCLVSLIIFLSTIASSQVSLVITTLILSFSFIANLPLQFLKSKEESENILFSRYSSTQAYNISKLYEAFDLQNYIKNNKIKYNNISYKLNDFLLNSSATKDDFSSFDENGNPSEIVKERFNFWNDLGLISKNNENYKYKLTNIKVSLFPKINDFNNTTYWNSTDNYDISFELKNRFISIDELSNLISSTSNESNKKILSDIYNFTNNIIKQLYNLQKTMVTEFSDFIRYLFINDIKNSFIINKNKSADTESIKQFKASYLISIYKQFFLKDGLSSSNPTEYFVLKDNQEVVDNFIKNDMYFPLMLSARLLEEYLIDPVSIYKISTNFPVIKNEADYYEYLSRRSLFNIFTYLSPFYNIWSNYTLYSGYSYNDFWFSPYSESNIDLTYQENILLPYITYKFVINNNGIIDKESYLNYIDPYIFLIIAVLLSTIVVICSYYKFGKKDLD
ncbi:ABC transporter permease [Spiroplasma corruscae]|uniref:ABC transporter permease n=1 Tax=Spiroplasma corruscae TaxID=216934 RepID=A0A222ENX4_9MOLU|nr:ABC transporter permease [Spiroplasma corruscae]ASP28210.1 ABC transporter permease [Spiroplasma corruscae]